MTTRLSTLCNEKLPDIVDTPALVVTWNVHVYRMYTSVMYSHVYASSFFTCCPRRYTYIDTVKILDQTNVLHHTHKYITGSCWMLLIASTALTYANVPHHVLIPSPLVISTTHRLVNISQAFHLTARQLSGLVETRQKTDDWGCTSIRPKSVGKQFMPEVI